MYSTVLYWGDGGHWSACLRVVKTRKRDTPAGWTLRSCSLCSMPPYESIESHERGGTDKMDVTRVLDPLDLSRCVESRLHARHSLQACTVCVINGSSRPGCSLTCRYEDERGVSGLQHAESLTSALCSLSRLCLKGAGIVIVLGTVATTTARQATSRILPAFLLLHTKSVFFPRPSNQAI